MTLLRVHPQHRGLVFTGHRGSLAEVPYGILTVFYRPRKVLVNNILHIYSSFEENHTRKPSLKKWSDGA